MKRWSIATVGLGLLGLLVSACGAATSAPPKAPASITVGTLFSGSGPFAPSSLPQLAGLKFWISQENSQGGVYVRAYKKRIPVKLVAYNDQSSPTTAATLYTQLITQNKVDILAADFGSVLTAPAVTIAEEHHQLLFDATATGTTLFSAANKYIVLTATPTSGIWPDPLIKFLLSKHVSRVAILYDSNDFAASQAATVNKGLIAGGVTPVYYQAVPTTTTSYGTLLQSIKATNPQAVLEFGYSTNDIPFLQALRAGGVKFPMVMTVYPGLLHQLLETDVGQAGLAYTFSYGFPPLVAYNSVNEGLGTSAFASAFAPSDPASVNFADVAGYQTGLVIQAALAHAPSLSQLALRNAVASVSGSLRTLDGSFKINAEGAQIGELLPVAQLFPSGSTTKIELVYPPASATHSPVYPAP
ncbi:MAG: ABC transporter substrate-binding protein [Candidatus Dormibacteria bacterium]